jgi:dipeptidyl aminopeptidase/acylaminoacyl peptidase
MERAARNVDRAGLAWNGREQSGANLRLAIILETMPISTLMRRPAVVLSLGLCAIAAVTTLLGRLTNGSGADTKPITLPDTAGVVAYPSFSPDGNRLAYSQRGVSSGDDVFHLWQRRVPSGAARQLTQGAGSDFSPAWSPDGASIAFLRV